MNIAYSTDENYAVHAYISLNSLLDSNKNEPEITCWLICNRLLEKTKDHFSDLVDLYNEKLHKRKIVFLDFVEYEEHVKDATPCGSLSTYGRIFLPEMCCVDRMLYIDCDTLVVGRLDDLYNAELSDIAVGGVQDIVALSRREPVGLQYGDRYINAGVSLINLKYWRENDGEQKCLDFINAFDGKVPFEDQGTINGVFKGHIKIFSPKYNMMNSYLDFSASQISTYMDVENFYSDEEMKEARSDIRIVHFTAGYYLRPWFSESNHPYKDKYLEYRKKSPWKDTALASSPRKLTIKEKLMHCFRKHCPLKIYAALKRIVKRFRKSI